MLKFAVIGIGSHAYRVLIPALNDAETAQLVALGSHSKAEQLRKEFPSLRVFDNYSECLAEVDALWIATPNHLHAENCIAALEANLHVICEKPLCLSTAEAEEIAQLAMSKNLHVSEGFAYRHHPQHQKVKELLPSIGSLRRLEIRYHYYLEDPQNIRLKAETGGGALNDVGCYGLDCARFLLEEEPLEINAKLQMKSGVDEYGEIDLLFSNEVTAKIIFGTRMQRGNSYTLWGEGGSINVPHAFHISRKKEGVINLDKQRLRVPKANQYVLECESFVEATKNPTPLDISNIKLMQAVREIT